MSCDRVPRLLAWLVVDYFTYVVRSSALAPRAARHQPLRLRRAYGCLRTSRGSSSTTSPTPRVQVPQHIAQLVAWLVVDYFAYVARPGATARRVARHSTRRRLLRPRRTSGCLNTSRGSSRGSSSTTSPTLCVQMPRHIVRLVAWLLVRPVVDYFASRGSSSTTSPTPCVRVPRHVARLVVDYFSHTARPDASTRRAAHRMAPCAARHRLLCLMRLVVDYFAYTRRPGASARRVARR
jgi:hypothetical protein